MSRLYYFMFKKSSCYVQLLYVHIMLNKSQKHFKFISIRDEKNKTINFFFFFVRMKTSCLIFMT